MTQNRMVRGLVMGALGMVMLGAPAVAKAGPMVQVGSLVFFEDGQGGAVLSIFNATEDTHLTGTLWVEGLSHPPIPLDADAGSWADHVLNFLEYPAVTRAYFVGTVGPMGPLGTFHLMGYPPGTGYVPVGPAAGALPDGDPNQTLLNASAPIMMEVDEVVEQVVPEPASLVLFGTGLALAVRARKRARRS